MQVESKSFFPTTRDLPQSALRQMADGVLNLVYPESCIICSVPVGRIQDCGVCERCWQNTLGLQLRRPWCLSCGIPFQSSAIEPGQLCGACTLRMPPWSGARSFGYYRAELSRLVQGLKFEGRRNLVGLLAPLLARAFMNSWERGEIDLVIPVPLHSKRRRQRGFNQAGLLGRGLARLAAVPFKDDVLARTRNTPPQVGLTDSERLKNVHQAFRCARPAEIARKRVLLVDDVMTTGATVGSATEALLNAGALRVSVLTLARAVSGPE